MVYGKPFSRGLERQPTGFLVMLAAMPGPENSMGGVAGGRGATGVQTSAVLVDTITFSEKPLYHREAARVGKNFYVGVKACPHGHGFVRRLRDANCATCHVLANRKRRARQRKQNREKENARKRRRTARQRLARLADPNYKPRVSYAGLAKAEIERIKKSNRRARQLAIGGRLKPWDIVKLERRQKSRCYWCGESIKAGFDVEHVVPLARGGGNGLDNVVLSCKPCNQKKFTRLPHELGWKLL